MSEAKAAEFISEHPLQSETGVLFSVFNDGPSIPPDVLPRLFDPYVSTKSLGRGLGLRRCARSSRRTAARSA